MSGHWSTFIKFVHNIIIYVYKIFVFYLFEPLNLMSLWALCLIHLHVLLVLKPFLQYEFCQSFHLYFVSLSSLFSCFSHSPIKFLNEKVQELFISHFPQLLSCL